MATSSTWRSRAGISGLLFAILLGVVGAGSYTAVADRNGAQAQNHTDGSQNSSSKANAGNGADSTTTPGLIAPFTTANQGACLTWEVDADGKVTDFEQTSCDGAHRFEVSVREDLATYPTSEFGADAKMPSQTRQAQLREELCHTPTIRYLDGRFDPVGKYSIAPILPPVEAWERGDRTMLCGLQVTDEEGEPQLTEGRAAEQDQARVAEPGQCLKVDSSNVLHIVDCAEDHQLEATHIENLTPVFPDRTPTSEEQDEHLKNVCTQAAMDYLGGEEQLYQSTLQPYWGTLPAASWDGGSRSVNCSLVHANEEGGFSTLKGTATDGRDGFTIDGEPPAEQPPRDPMNTAASPSAERPAP
ncbi:septum formation family protein [Corynebacterium cystitidis]|uniref:septum formation family protein n=1 Tax=Corynebacterium cystitidis TaxID=35757 RepID=UPI00211ED41B|nr:septum formation family protein [Corynebacterium cystitidis]